MYRKLSYILMAALALGSAACSDQNDVVDGIVEDAKNRPWTADIAYTLSDADYTAVSSAATTAATTDRERALAAAVRSSGSLNRFATSDRFVPALLASKYPALRQGSTVQVSYGYTEDYLANLAASPVETVMAESFESYEVASGSPYTKWDQNGWSQHVTRGDGSKYWQVRSYNSNKYGQVSANGGVTEVTEIYMVSSAITLSEPAGNSFSFDVCVGYWNWAGLAVLVSEDAAAASAPATVQWTDVTASFTIPTEPASGYGTLSPAGSISLDAYTGKTIHIAFRYNGETGENTRTTTYQIDNVKVVNGDASITVVPGAAYINDGSGWALYPDGFSLVAADYTAMGSTTGGLTLSEARRYLPEFLARKFTALDKYPVEGWKRAVVYNTPASAVTAEEFVFTGGKWVPSIAGALKTEQFIYGDQGWMFDPTVNHTMVSADYQLVVTAVLDDPATSMFVRGTYKNEEWYYGFNAYYNNVSFRLLGTGASREGVPSSVEYDTELHALDGDTAAQAALLWKRLIEKGMPLYLRLKWPLATVQVQGVDVMYNITVVVYYPDGVTYQSTGTPFVLTYGVTTSGTASSPAIFEYVKGAPAEFYTAGASAR